MLKENTYMLRSSAKSTSCRGTLTEVRSKSEVRWKVKVKLKPLM